MKTDKMKVLWVSCILCLLFSCKPKELKKERKLLIQCGTEGGRGSCMEFFDDGSYTLTCFLYRSWEGRYQLNKDTVLLDEFKDKCGPRGTKLLIKYKQDGEETIGKIYELDNKNEVIDLPTVYSYRINIDKR